jgi:hypothetical protein
MKAVMLALSLLLVAGCSDHYRYPCQDPANWNSEECQRPQCEAEGICPDQLLGREITESKVEAVEESNEAAPCEQPNSEETGE